LGQFARGTSGKKKIIMCFKSNLSDSRFTSCGKNSRLKYLFFLKRRFDVGQKTGKNKSIYKIRDWIAVGYPTGERFNVWSDMQAL
jgi:hypothetical protein